MTLLWSGGGRIRGPFLGSPHDFSLTSTRETAEDVRHMIDLHFRTRSQLHCLPDGWGATEAGAVKLGAERLLRRSSRKCADPVAMLLDVLGNNKPIPSDTSVRRRRCWASRVQGLRILFGCSLCPWFSVFFFYRLWPCAGRKLPLNIHTVNLIH
jgi:hypothetical protein